MIIIPLFFISIITFSTCCFTPLLPGRVFILYFTGITATFSLIIFLSVLLYFMPKQEQEQQRHEEKGFGV